MVKRLKENEIVKYRAISLYWNYKENILEYDLIITLDEYLSGICNCYLLSCRWTFIWIIKIFY